MDKNIYSHLIQFIVIDGLPIICLIDQPYNIFLCFVLFDIINQCLKVNLMRFYHSPFTGTSNLTWEPSPTSIILNNQVGAICYCVPHVVVHEVSS